MEDLETIFEGPLAEGDYVGNLKICVSGGGKYYFKVVKKETADTPEEIIANHNNYYGTIEELKDMDDENFKRIPVQSMQFN